MIAVADSGFIVAVTIASDKAHARCVSLYKQHQKIYVPQSTLAEVGYLLTKSAGNQGMVRFLRQLPTARTYAVVSLQSEDFTCTAEILGKYADTRVDFVDATIAAPLPNG